VLGPRGKRVSVYKIVYSTTVVVVVFDIIVIHIINRPCVYGVSGTSCGQVLVDVVVGGEKKKTESEREREIEREKEMLDKFSLARDNVRAYIILSVRIKPGII
jgi:hypothetical protein